MTDQSASIVMSCRSLLLNRAIRLTGMKRRNSSAEKTRRHIEGLTLRPARYGPSRALVRGLSVSVQRVGGAPVYTAAPAGQAPGRHVLYLHGGAYTYESHRSTGGSCASSHSAFRPRL